MFVKWVPFTCPCVIWYQYDDDLAPADRVLVPVETTDKGEATFRCEMHADKTNITELFQTVIAYNKEMNPELQD